MRVKENTVPMRICVTVVVYAVEGRHRFLIFYYNQYNTSMKATTKHTAPINPVEKTKVEADPKAAPANKHDKESERRKRTGVTIDPKTQKP
jgi:hypothetical protein